MSNFNKGKSNSYENGSDKRIASNSLDIEMGDALTNDWEFAKKAWIWETIIGVSITKKVFESDNETVDSELVIFDPVKESTEYEMIWDWTFVSTDVNKFFDLTVAQLVDESTRSATTGQVKMVEFINATKWKFVIANA